MSRPSRGKEVLQKAKDYLGKARTVEELRVSVATRKCTSAGGLKLRKLRSSFS